MNILLKLPVMKIFVRCPLSLQLPQETSHRLVEFSGSGWALHVDRNWRVDAAALVHRIPSFGFVLKESPSPGQLSVAKLQVTCNDEN
jgi:hypothetical protein